MLGILAVIFFCIYFYIQTMSSIFNLYKDAGGMWHEDRFRPLIAALANLAMNLITVNFWGIYGVLASTFISTLVISVPWLLHNLFTVIFDKSHLKPYLLTLIFYTIVTVATCALTYLICYFIPLQNEWAVFFVRLAICVVVPNVIFFIIYSRMREFKETLQLLNRITRGKIKFLRKYENLPQPAIVNVTGQQSSVNVQSDMLDIEHPVEAKLSDDNSQLPESVNIKSEQDMGSTENDPNQK